MIKNVFFTLMAVILFSCGNNGEVGINAGFDHDSDMGTAQITFSEYEHDFGKIYEGEQVSCFFKYTNTGTADLIVASASASCGCTVPKYDVKPIRPGDSGTMEVRFDSSGRNGVQTKTITVKSNAGSPVVMLKISADVISN
jgi:hypothetical protein